MARRIYAFYADKFTDAEWQNMNGGNTPRFQSVYETFKLACQSAGVSEYYMGGYRYGVNPEYDKQFGLKSSGISILPQILFVLDPDQRTLDNFLSTGGEIVMVAKLVQGQITRKNMEIMLKTVKSLEYRIDPSSGAPSFYDPTFRLFGYTSIGFNPASAPGGSVIGLGLQERLTLNRGGQVLNTIFSTLKKLLPWVVVGAIAYKYNDGQKKR